MRKFSDCVTIANSGSVGTTFYHRYKFVASDHVTQLLRDGLNEHSYQYTVTILRRLSEKYSFNREINDKRIRSEKIILPTTEDGSPDWQYMEDYMKYIEQRQLRSVIEAMKKRLS